jgi:hypothetical protein
VAHRQDSTDRGELSHDPARPREVGAGTSSPAPLRTAKRAGWDNLLKGRPRPDRVRDGWILSVGRQLAEQLRAAGTLFFDSQPRHDETPEEAQSRIRGRDLALGTALWRMRIRSVNEPGLVEFLGASRDEQGRWHEHTRINIEKLRAEYNEIVGDPPTISQREVQAHFVYVSHGRKRSTIKAGQRKELGHSHVATFPDLVSPPRARSRGRPHKKPDPVAILEACHERGIKLRWERLLTPNELQQLEAFCSRADDTELAERWKVKPSTVRSRRSRLAARLQQIVTRWMEVQSMNETQTSTLAERVTDHEARLMELEHQVGLPPGGDKAAEESVERLLTDLESES